MRDPENAPVEQRHVIAHAQHELIDVPALELAVDDALQKLGGPLVGGVGIGETRLHHDSRRLGVDRWLQYLDSPPEQVIPEIGEPDDATHNGSAALWQRECQEVDMTLLAESST